MVYCSCHGVSYSDRQVILLNSNEKATSFFFIEYLLRDLVRDTFSKARVFSIFDCCRTSVEKNKLLCSALEGRGESGHVGVELKAQGNSAKYMHVCSADAGQKALLDAGFALKTKVHVQNIKNSGE